MNVISLDMLNFMSSIRPGAAVKKMLLYFPKVNEFKLWNDYSTADKEFVFEKGSERITDFASKWIEIWGN